MSLSIAAAQQALLSQNIVLHSMSIRQAEEFIDGSSDVTLERVATAAKVLRRSNVARFLAVEAKGELMRRARNRVPTAA